MFLILVPQHNRRNNNSDKKKSRRRNPLIDKKKHQSTRHCGRQRLYVSFDELKLSDVIIAPTGYESFHCEGSCRFPIPNHVEQTNHAIMQTLAHILDPQSAAEPCCAPYKYGNISVIYVRKETIYHLKKFYEMVAVKCTCQWQILFFFIIFFKGRCDIYYFVIGNIYRGLGYFYWGSYLVRIFLTRLFLILLIFNSNVESVDDRMLFLLFFFYFLLPCLYLLMQLRRQHSMVYCDFYHTSSRYLL